jgi:hypothetical protein
MEPTPDDLDVPLETPVEDAVEQSIIADPLDDAAEEAVDPAAIIHRGLEVGEWDATEQVRTAGLDDDYR